MWLSELKDVAGRGRERREGEVKFGGGKRRMGFEPPERHEYSASPRA